MHKTRMNIFCIICSINRNMLNFVKLKNDEESLKRNKTPESKMIQIAIKM